MPEESLYKIGQVARQLNVAPNTVRNAIESGHLRAYLLPGRGRGTYRVPEGAIREYLEAHVVRPKPSPQPCVSTRGRPFKHLSLGDD